MSERITLDGRFVIRPLGPPETVATLYPSTPEAGCQWPVISLLFGVDSRDFLRQGFVPKIYGRDRLADYQAKVRGTVTHVGDNVNPVMSSISYFELLDNGVDPAVTYVFRLDDEGYQQEGVLPSISSDLAPLANPIRIKIQCNFSCDTDEGKMRIVTPKPGRTFVVPDEVAAYMCTRLRHELVQRPGGAVAMMALGSGIIEGAAQLHDADSPCCLVPDVITIEAGIAIHRLWLNRDRFRWFIEEELVNPIY